MGAQAWSEKLGGVFLAQAHQEGPLMGGAGHLQEQEGL